MIYILLKTVILWEHKDKVCSGVGYTMDRLALPAAIVTLLTQVWSLLNCDFFRTQNILHREVDEFYAVSAHVIR